MHSTNPSHRRHQDALTPERILELKDTLAKMRAASNAFYAAAQMCGNHSFIEFTGLQNEYISVCSKALDVGIDFTQANTHSGKALPMESYNLAYLGEKLNCIYGPSLTADPKSAEMFIQTILGTHGQ